MELLFKRFNFPSLPRYAWVLWASGLHLMLVHFIAVQQLSLAIRRPFFAMIIYTLGYFLSISLGYAVSHIPRMKYSRLIFPFFLVQTLFLVFAQPLAIWIQNELGTLFMYSAMLAFLIIFSASWGALFLPAVLRDYPVSMTSAYRLEILGSICGLLLLFAAGQIGFRYVFAVYLITWVLFSVLLRFSKIMTAALIAVSAGLFLFYPSWDHAAAVWVYQKEYPDNEILNIVHSRNSIYQKVEVAINRRSEKILLLNGKRQFTGTSGSPYSYFVAELPAQFLQNPEVLIMGCGSMATAGKIGERAARITIVDIDSEVFNASYKHFQDFNRLSKLKNWEFIADDASHFLGNARLKYDLILHDIYPARSRQTALTYSRDFFEMVKSRLSANGLFAVSSLTPLDSGSSYGRNLAATLADVFENYFVIEYKGSIYFYGGAIERSLPSKDQVKFLLEQKGMKGYKIYSREEFIPLTKSGKVITRNNLGDLVLA